MNSFYMKLIEGKLKKLAKINRLIEEIDDDKDRWELDKIRKAIRDDIQVLTREFLRETN